MSWGGCDSIRPADILVLKDQKDETELARYIVVSARRQGHACGLGQEVVYTLYTIGTHPFNTPLPGVSEKVGTTLTLTRQQMINNYTEVWSKLC